MQNQDTKNSLVSNGNAPNAEHDEKLLRFTRRLDMHHDLEKLLQALPTELGNIIACNTTALLYQYEGTVSWHVADLGGYGTPPLPSIAEWQETILPLVYGHKRELVFSSLNEETRFPETTKFFRGCGDESLCVLPLNTALHRLGAICVGREYKDAFSEYDVCFLRLIADYASL